MILVKPSQPATSLKYRANPRFFKKCFVWNSLVKEKDPQTIASCGPRMLLSYFGISGANMTPNSFAASSASSRFSLGESSLSSALNSKSVSPGRSPKNFFKIAAGPSPAGPIVVFSISFLLAT